jgi:hypothetical protein
MRTDRQTDGWKDRRRDMMKLIVAFRNFANAPGKRVIHVPWGTASGESKVAAAPSRTAQGAATLMEE